MSADRLTASFTVLLFWVLAASAQTTTIPQSPPKICVNNVCRSASNPNSSGGSGVKWHPGHYVLSNQLVRAGNNQWANRKVEIDNSLSQANILGFMDIHMWNSIETGQSAYNWANIDQARSYIATNYPGKRYAVMIWSEDFSTANPAYSVPGYILSNSNYGPGYNGNQYGYGYWQMSDTSVTAAIWRPAVAARITALFQALATHASPYSSGFTYDTDPYFEAVTYQETSMSLAGGSDASEASIATQWTAITTAIINSFPHTNVLDQNNYLTASSQAQTAAVGLADMAAGAAASSPDITSNFTWGQLGYLGAANGGTSGFTSQFRAAPYIALVEVPDYTQTSLSQITQAALNQPSASPTGLGASEVFWNIESTGSGQPGDWQTQVLPNINSHPIPGANQSCPSNYTRMRGGCNTN